MAILERHVQINVESDETYREWEKSWEGVESRLGGFPPKRHYALYSGSESVGTMVWEREWESLAAMEAAYAPSETDPETQRLMKRASEILEQERVEFYFVWE